MNVPEIRLFIKNLIYDLDTITYLLDYERNKDTLVILDRIFNDIDSFHSQFGNLESPLKDILNEKSLERSLRKGMTLKEMRDNIRQFSQNYRKVTDEDLKNNFYIDFIEKVNGWAQINISKLRYEIKSSLLKKVEKRISYLGIIAGLSLVIVLSLKFLTRDLGGLNASFYQGREYAERYLFSEYKKTINFPNLNEMDPRLPFNDFSALFEGELLIPKDGLYTIFESSDGGTLIEIDGKRIIFDWGKHEEKESFINIPLSKGSHKIILKYYRLEESRTAVLKLSWAIDGGKKGIIPAKYLRH